ncbi:hypothetical protein Ciccas_013375 [Cichlidogyrus casuarinus]|uniref:Calx-beta domain-containing protein n=1 Tax=Cichlidogyrus casuarinus TaxID=1844966 RepID=A0ABD2PLZ7_9PLAT
MEQVRRCHIHCCSFQVDETEATEEMMPSKTEPKITRFTSKQDRKTLETVQGNYQVFYETRDGTAKANVHYKPTSGILRFTDSEAVHQIAVNVQPYSSYRDENLPGMDELEFFVMLSEISPNESGFSDCLVAPIGRPSVARVRILLHDGQLTQIVTGTKQS